jgi:diguanylate cyclase (GGDEF)-like protein
MSGSAHRADTVTTGADAPPATPTFGLRARFLSLLGLALAISLLVIGSAWYQQWAGHQAVAELGREAMDELVHDGVRERGESVARLLAEALANPLYYFDLASVGEIARSALRQPDIAYVLVFDPEGRVIHDGSGDIPTFGQPMLDSFAAGAVLAEALHTQRSSDRVDVTVPIRIGRDRIGGVRVGLSLEGPARVALQASDALQQRVDRTAERSLVMLAGLLGGLLMLGAVLSLLISRGLVQPIRRLADAARQVGAGDYRLRLPGRRRDELGELERAFVRMSAALARHDAEIRRIAYTDSLTGLPNRAALRDMLQRRLSAGAGTGQLALMFVDLDDFKRVNDTLGHEAGDEVLEQFAQRLQQCLGLSDDPDGFVARFGGDEFVVLFAADDARETARQLGEAVLVELQRPLAVRGKQVFLGASIGITTYPDDADRLPNLLKFGDIAMYQAKVAGKNCLRFYNRSMDQAVEHSMALEQALRGAWDRGELSLSFQPIYELVNRRLVGAEALLRWNHPELGQIEPAAFVEIAEQSGLIDGIGEHVLLEACQTAQRWPTSGIAPFVSVNVSPRQLRSGELPDLVATALARSGLPAERLHIELTETAVLGDELQISALLARLRAMGVKIWLDDFGTGFSGLSHLRRVPVDGLKIDKSFIADVLHDPDDLALTTAIIAMGHSLGITVVAEGVESEAQFTMLRERGCDFAQGFWLGHPVPDAEFSTRAEA